jgi:hypothetical protein
LRRCREGIVASVRRHGQPFAQRPFLASQRIGNGPWHNAKGVLIAANLADLHDDVQHDGYSSSAKPRSAKKAKW